MKIVDELDTPGCPNCAIKHLSAALAHLLDTPRVSREIPYSDIEIYLARAAINLVEAATGYESHKWFAIGLMERAEELSAVVSPQLVIPIRTVRTDFASGEASLSETVSCLSHLIGTGAVFAAAHLQEAKREFPGCAIEALDAEVITAELEKITQEYFVTPEVGVTSTNEERSHDMATKKVPAKKTATAKKETPKAEKQAACKGGKCKGGKSCKK